MVIIKKSKIHWEIGEYTCSKCDWLFRKNKWFERFISFVANNGRSIYDEIIFEGITFYLIFDSDDDIVTVRSPRSKPRETLNAAVLDGKCRHVPIPSW